ncbi:MAG: hypothetical protein PVJ26_19105 [Anaerolineae bacterium]|jgi:hypothetical protein
MSYHDTVSALFNDAEQLEQTYQVALKAGEADAFKAAIDSSYAYAPENLLYAAWFHRLKSTAAQAKGFAIAWAWVMPLAAINALLFWLLSDDHFMITIEGFHGRGRDFVPVIFILAASLCAVLVLFYLTTSGHKRWRLSVLYGILLLVTGAYVLLTYPQTGPVPFQEQYLTLMAMHLPLLAWTTVGAFLTTRHRDPTSRFSFLIKSLEVFILGGLFLIAGGLFTAITFGLFEALNVNFPEPVQRLFVAGGAGLIGVVAPAVIYNPTVPPAEQAFDEGLSKLVALLMRILLPLTFSVLLVYLAFIPFNFRAPFENRDVLIIYNGMLFAVVALLVGATPVSLGDVSPRLARWLRLAIVAVASLALIVSLYALAAILYRTLLDRLTPNRLAFIGWNVVNTGLLFLVLLFQVRARTMGWVQRLYRAYSAGTIAYASWTVVVILAIPWLFGINQGDVEALPLAVQEIVYEDAAPILLKCTGSPHIYLLEKGEKRWIDSIVTFSDRGYVWRDVHFVSCDDLRSIPDGRPIPADAGPPPQP